MSRRRIQRRFLVVVLVQLLSVAAVAQTHPADELGFAAEKAFHVGPLDAVNEHNGNLLITVPLGAYGVTDTLHYSFQVAYNSKVWEFEQELSYPFYWHVVPSRDSNASLGWFFSVGGDLRLPCESGILPPPDWD